MLSQATLKPVSSFRKEDPATVPFFEGNRLLRASIASRCMVK